MDPISGAAAFVATGNALVGLLNLIRSKQSETARDESEAELQALLDRIALEVLKVENAQLSHLKSQSRLSREALATLHEMREGELAQLIGVVGTLSGRLDLLHEAVAGIAAGARAPTPREEALRLLDLLIQHQEEGLVMELSGINGFALLIPGTGVLKASPGREEALLQGALRSLAECGYLAPRDRLRPDGPDWKLTQDGWAEASAVRGQGQEGLLGRLFREAQASEGSQ